MAVNPVYQKISLEEYTQKTQGILNDLNTGKKWLNNQCMTVKKDGKIIRYLKCILSVILPINLLESIKASKVARSVFEFAKTNVEHLQDDDAYQKTLDILEKLNTLTQGKYKVKMDIASKAVIGLTAD